MVSAKTRTMHEKSRTAVMIQIQIEGSGFFCSLN